MNVMRPLVFFALLCVAMKQPVASEVTGNYELLICKSSCSFEQPQSAIARGVVVLSEEPLAPSVIEKLGLSHFVSPNEARACFAGSHSGDAETFAFLRKASATSWTIEGSLLKFELFRSGDAGYEVELERKGNVLVGKGVSWGAGVAAPHYRSDIIVGRRSGSVNISACLEPAT